jgi:hypothetical protein
MTDKIQILDENVLLAELDQYPDLFICLSYLMFKEMKKPETNDTYTMDQIVDLLDDQYPGQVPTTRQGLYGRIESWRRDGTLKRAEELFIAPKAEELRAAIGRVISAMPDALDKLINDMLHGKSAKNRLEIFAYLRENVVMPVILGQEDPGIAEKEYIKGTKRFDPTHIEPD